MTLNLNYCLFFVPAMVAPVFLRIVLSFAAFSVGAEPSIWEAIPRVSFNFGILLGLFAAAWILMEKPLPTWTLGTTPKD